MKKISKKWNLLFTSICIIILLAGCSVKKEEVPTAEQNRLQMLEDETDTVSKYAVSLETVYFKNPTDTQHSFILRSVLGLFDTKVLYYTMGSDHNMCYLYDFETRQCQALGGLGDFRYAKLKDSFIDDSLYFSLEGNDLWTVDFSDAELSRPTSAQQSLLLGQMTNMGEHILAIMSEKSPDGTMEYCLQTIDKSGTFSPVTLQYNDLNSFAMQSADHKIRHIDSDGQYLFALETIGTEDTCRYYVTKYTYDLECVSAKEITSILAAYGIDSVTYFYAFGDYFVVHDFTDSYTILCRYTDNKYGEIEILLSGDQLTYVENSGVNDTFEYFYQRRTNDLFRLNKQTGVITPIDCTLNNHSSSIQWIKASNDLLLIEKAAEADSEDKHDYWYLVPGENLIPQEDVLPNGTNDNDGFVEAGKVYVEVVD